MPDIQFMTWHTARSGSNMLMNMLHQTGVAGVRDYINCGFFVGYPDSWNFNYDFQKKCKQYLDKQRTKNGVTGTKSSMHYFNGFRAILNDYEVDNVLNSFTHHIHLIRRDKVEQAVSRLVAVHTNIWSTLELDKGTNESKTPVYSRQKIDEFIRKTENDNKEIEDYFEENGITPHIVYYEDVCKNAPYELRKIIQFLGITDTYVFKQAFIRKQIDSRKDEFIERYLAGE